MADRYQTNPNTTADYVIHMGKEGFCCDLCEHCGVLPLAEINTGYSSVTEQVTHLCRSCLQHMLEAMDKEQAKQIASELAETPPFQG